MLKWGSWDGRSGHRHHGIVFLTAQWGWFERSNGHSQRPATLTAPRICPPDGLKRWIALNLIDRRLVEGGPWAEVNCVLKLEGYHGKMAKFCQTFMSRSRHFRHKCSGLGWAGDYVFPHQDVAG